MEIKIRDFGLGSDLISLTNKAGVTISFTIWALGLLTGKKMESI